LTGQSSTGWICPLPRAGLYWHGAFSYLRMKVVEWCAYSLKDFLRGCQQSRRLFTDWSDQSLPSHGAVHLQQFKLVNKRVRSARGTIYAPCQRNLPRLCFGVSLPYSWCLVAK
jgi:hypothetical protein